MKVKTNKNTHPSKATVCLASLSHKPELASQGTANMRTLKSMRASLAGVPIVTIDWILSCIEQSRIVNPKATICIRTLQSKLPMWMNPINNDSYQERALNGVLHIAARLRKLQILARSKNEVFTLKILRNCVVFASGIWKKGYGPKINDVNTLIKDCGGQVTDSAPAFLNILSSKRATTSSKRFYVICDESTNDNESGMNGLLYKECEQACNNEKLKGSIYVVNSSYLFDCISCGEILNSVHYPPSAPNAKHIWSLCQHGSLV